ncbi:cytochrome c oxidase subunit 3 [Novipirellula rosea]|uniref:Cytochrome c oxidase subunit 3 n=1 Tax=Novipirellula rosea TaxID=1031540 RepID=A0ABP8MSD1_9BACT|tara:strand:- start:5599 stop:6213 length:615 start_codon:yes stop_codon:yes gene_type:complete
MPTSATQPPIDRLPTDRRFQQGGWLFLGSLLVFFLSSILLYGFYAYSRRGDALSALPIPMTFLVSTVCLLGISLLVHIATRMIRRERRVATAALMGISAVLAIVFTGFQILSMYTMLSGPAVQQGNGKGLVGMVIVLAFLHALHVAGGIISLGLVSVRLLQGRYDHERHWPVDFAAQYWHFLDIVWLCMLLVFWTTTGGFAWSS